MAMVDKPGSGGTYARSLLPPLLSMVSPGGSAVTGRWSRVEWSVCIERSRFRFPTTQLPPRRPVLNGGCDSAWPWVWCVVLRPPRP